MSDITFEFKTKREAVDFFRNVINHLSNLPEQYQDLKLFRFGVLASIKPRATKSDLKVMDAKTIEFKWGQE
jgi:hypothetical protein